jgi:hypothetical protein
MEKTSKKLQVIQILMRYIFLLGVALIFNFSDFFYSLLLNLTIYPTNFLLNLFFDSLVHRNNILVESQIISIIPACVAVFAYLLLIILNLSVSMKLSKRVYTLLFSIFCLLFFNIIRITIFSLLLLNDFKYYSQLHMFFWYVLSTIFIIGIWFLAAYLFKIKNIPIYSDFKLIIKNIKTK